MQALDVGQKFSLRESSDYLSLVWSAVARLITISVAICLGLFLLLSVFRVLYVRLLFLMLLLLLLLLSVVLRYAYGGLAVFVFLVVFVVDDSNSLETR